MTGLGLLATGAAYLNYKQAKADYDALVEKRDGLLAAVQTFNAEKDKEYLELEEEYVKNHTYDYPDGVQYSAILRTAYLVGDMFRCITSVVFTNLSDKTYEIGTVAADCFVLNGGKYMPISVYKVDVKNRESKVVKQEVFANITLRPTETVEIALPKGISAVPDMAALRQMVCDACGKSPITSCPKKSIENGIQANIMFKWCEQGESEWKKALTENKYGVFRYCMELPLNANS